MMAVRIVSSAERIVELESLDPGLRDLSLGVIRDDLLSFRCRSSPLYAYSESEDAAELSVAWEPGPGSRVVPLWECDASLIAAVRNRGTRYVEIDMEDPENVLEIGSSSQALLAYLLYYIIEDLGGTRRIRNGPGDSERRVRALASRLGFTHLDELLNLHAAVAAEPEAIAKLLAYTDSLED
jgi:hypothetical protein